MKKIWISVCLLLCVLVFAGCHNDNTSHAITMNDEDWLYEKLPSSANAGDTVTVRINKAYDLGYIFLVNGEKIDMEDYTDEYWQFTFTMPDEDVEIDFKTYDGFLPDMNYAVLIETFWLQNPDAEFVSVREYYDEYESGAIAAMIDAWDYTSNEWSEEVAGCRFEYGDGNRLQVLYDGAFYTLPEAYENGYLSKENIEKIFGRYVFQHPGVYAENNE